MDPKPVRVTYPDGAEEMGLLVAEDRLELGPRGRLLALGERMLVDGTRREVVEVRMRGRMTTDASGRQSPDQITLVRLGLPPAPHP